jgi:hypothetical protein
MMSGAERGVLVVSLIVAMPCAWLLSGYLLNELGPMYAGFPNVAIVMAGILGFGAWGLFVAVWYIVLGAILGVFTLINHNRY